MATRTTIEPVLRTDKLEERVGLLEYQFREVLQPTLIRIESKQDAAIKQLDTLRYVSQHEFEQYKADATRQFVTNRDIQPMRTLFWAIITAIVLGVISFGFFLARALVVKS